MISGAAGLLRVFVGADARRHGRPLCDVVVELARSTGMAGASAFPAELGLGADGRIEDAESEYRSREVPIVVEVVDTLEKLERFLGELEAILDGEVATLAPVQAARCIDQSGAIGRPPEDRAIGQDAGEEAGMAIESRAQRMTVYIGSADTWNGRNLAVEIVERCRRLGIAGATASRGILGFGKSSVVHRARLLGLSQDLPERVEIIDRPDQIARIQAEVEGLVAGGLIVIEDIRVVRYGHHEEEGRA